MFLQDRKCIGNETLRRVHLITVTVGKALRTKYFERVFILALLLRMRSIVVIWGMSGFTIRFHISS